jgi:hypothetical protein
MNYQVLRVKPDDLEAALNEMGQRGWQVHSILPASLAGRQILGRQTLNVYTYHVVLYRKTEQPARR